MKLPGYIVYILSRLETSGHEAFLAGGCVRDCIMGRAPHDWDITTSAMPEEVMAVFPHTAPTGIKYGTVTVLTEEGSAEVTTFRCDGVYSGHRRPENVEFVHSLAEDLKRRDFTINAMAMDKSGALTDLFGGVEDIKRRVIRCVGEPERRFSEDALRMFRAIRFSAVLGFEIESDTRSAIESCAGLAVSLSGERVRDELEKTIMSETPEKVADIIRLGLMTAYGLSAASAADDKLFYRIGLLPKEPRLRWSGLCAAVCREAGAAERLLSGLRLDRETIRGAAAGERLWKNIAAADKSKIKLLLKDNGREAVLCAAAWQDIINGDRAVKRVRDISDGSECCRIKDLAINGSDIMKLGIREGREIGKILDLLFLYVLEDEKNNSRERLTEKARELINE